MTAWTPERRISIARRISSTLLQEARGIVMSSRVAELSELIFYVLSMPDEILDANAAKFRKFDKGGHMNAIQAAAAALRSNG